MVGSRIVATLTAAVSALGLAAVGPVADPALGRMSPGPAGRDVSSAAQARHVSFERWSRSRLDDGRLAGARIRHRAVVVGPGSARVRYNDPYDRAGARRYDRGAWTSPWARSAFGLTELIASYDATAPVGTFIEVSVRGRSRAAGRSSWDSLGRWASHDTRFHRMSLGPQHDDLASVAVDTLTTNGRVRLDAWQLRVDLYRRAGGDATPRLTMVGAVASRVPSRAGAVSTPGTAAGT